MQLSAEAIKEFQDIYRKEFKEEIDSTRAQALGVNLLRLMKVIYRPIPTKEMEIKRYGKRQ